MPVNSSNDNEMKQLQAAVKLLEQRCSELQQQSSQLPASLHQTQAQLPQEQLTQQKDTGQLPLKLIPSPAAKLLPKKMTFERAVVLLQAGTCREGAILVLNHFFEVLRQRNTARLHKLLGSKLSYSFCSNLFFTQ